MKHEAYDLSGILLHSSSTQLNGIGLNTKDKYLSIINAFDETGFSDVRDKNHMYTKFKISIHRKISYDNGNG